MRERWKLQPQPDTNKIDHVQVDACKVDIVALRLAQYAGGLTDDSNQSSGYKGLRRVSIIETYELRTWPNEHILQNGPLHALFKVSQDHVLVNPP
jgi:hypothetical protein